MFNVRKAFNVLVKEHQQGNYRVARLLRGTLQLAYLALCQQQLAVALHLVVVVCPVEVGTPAHAFHPQLSIDDGTIGIHQTGLSQTDALDLRTCQHDACREGLDEEVFKLGLLVLYLYRTLLPDLFFCLVHFVND